MDQNTMKDLVIFWAKSLFIQPILILAFIFCFITALICHHREKERIFFIPYFFTGVTLFTVANPVILRRIFATNEITIAEETTNTIFELIEFIAFYYFFKKSLHHKRFKKILKLFLMSFLVITLVFFTALGF